MRTAPGSMERLLLYLPSACMVAQILVKAGASNHNHLFSFSMNIVFADDGAGQEGRAHENDVDTEDLPKVFFTLPHFAMLKRTWSPAHNCTDISGCQSTHPPPSLPARVTDICKFIAAVSNKSKAMIYS